MCRAISAPSRRLACARCGTTFDCGLSADCWCAEEGFRLPMPAAADADCLCPACLRKAAELSAAQNTAR
jgi:cysteine-rich CWC protein